MKTLNKSNNDTWTSSCVSLSDRRGTGFPSEGANGPDQTPAGAPGAGDRHLRHGERAPGLQQPGHLGLSQGRLQMRRGGGESPQTSIFLGTPLLSLELTRPDVSVLTEAHSNTDASRTSAPLAFLGRSERVSGRLGSPSPTHTHLDCLPPLLWRHKMRKIEKKKSVVVVFVRSMIT